jgi:ferredoxin
MDQREPVPITEFEVRIEPQGWVFHTDGRVSLLKAAQAVGVRLPRSCQNGSCRTCLCLRVSGTVRHTIDWPSLSADEKAEGCILPCVAVAESHVVLRVPGAELFFPDEMDGD